ncbi:MAG: phosphopantothenoylcysteine decarboxylase [Planctomycetota bacterium]|nr:phosphopantothenoylcysteine decarboxylase [Planctomycetota bacterium]MDA1179593.1 phosphopantothenoylcysteine decarboxylase [Planctomycetota bacterium]
MSTSQIVVGVTGGIAAFKTARLVSDLVQCGIQVDVVMTSDAQEFVGAATFAALTGRPVCTQRFDARFPLGAHIELARGRDCLCIAPATANFLAKAAVGIADDLLSTLYLSFVGTVIIAPAMNVHMWEHATVRRNVRQLEKDGVTIVAPGTGWLSCRDEGAGRMAEPEQIRTVIQAGLRERRPDSTDEPADGPAKNSAP